MLLQILSRAAGFARRGRSEPHWACCTTRPVRRIWHSRNDDKPLLNSDGEKSLWSNYLLRVRDLYPCKGLQRRCSGKQPLTIILEVAVGRSEDSRPGTMPNLADWDWVSPVVSEFRTCLARLCSTGSTSGWAWGCVGIRSYAPLLITAGVNYARGRLEHIARP